MIAAGTLLSIMAVHLAAAISPGPSFVVAVHVSASRGFGSASLLALGFGVGAVVWASGALFGLSLVFQIAPGVLTVIKIAGAVFLVVLALMMWRHADEPLPLAPSDASVSGAFRLGLSTQLANPKPAVFFGAVFVGLLPPDLTQLDMVLILAMIFLMETGWYILVARIFSLSAARAGYIRFKSSADRVFGTFLGVLGLKLALQ